MGRLNSAVERHTSVAVIRVNPGNAAEGLRVGHGDLIWISEPSA
jgi:hypothetical protein